MKIILSFWEVINSNNVLILSSKIGFVGDTFEKNEQSKSGKTNTLARGSNNLILFLSLIASSWLVAKKAIFAHFAISARL